VVFFFSFIVKVPIRPACAGAFKIAWISTYPTVQIRRTTSVSHGNLSHLVAAAQELELTPTLPVPLSSLTQIELLKEWHTQRNLLAFALRSPDLAGVTVDVLLFPPVPPQELCQRALTIDVAGVPVRLAHIDDLIALKQHAGRPIDLSDIEHLKKLSQA
jgi:hypothetical protein